LPGEVAEACKGADLAIDLALEGDEHSASAHGTEALLSACSTHGVGSVILCSDALVGYEPSADVTDGDELWDAGPSLERLGPRKQVVASGRLEGLRRAEEALANHHAVRAATKGATGGAVVLRMHRLFSPGAEQLSALVPLLLASGVGMACAGARALTNLTHVEDAALGLVLATDKLLAATLLDELGELQTLVMTDPTLWSAAHLLRCLAATCRLPAPLLPLLLAPLRLLGAVASKLLFLPYPPALAAAHTHCHFTGAKAAAALGFAPKAGAAGLHAAMLSVRARTGLALRLVAPLLLAALTLLVDASGAPLPAAAAAAAAALVSLVYALVPPPPSLPPQGEVYPAVVSGGLPLIGHLPGFIKGPVSMFDGLRARYRSVFTIYVGPQRFTVMVGAEAQKSFAQQKDEMLSQAAVYGFTVPVFGKGIIYDSPLEEYLQQVKLMVKSMNTKSLENMVPKMIGEAEGYFKKWGNEGEVELRKVFSELIILTASACLMGREIREGLSDDIARIYASLDGGLTPLSTLWPSAPTAAHRERDRARKEMEGIFAPIIAARRSGEVVEDDFLQKIIEFRYEDYKDKASGKLVKGGRGFTDSEVVGLLVVLLFAGQHTSSITSTWLGARLLDSPEVCAEVRAEQQRLCPDKASLTYENLMKMDAMRRSVTEALRLYPPLVLLMRKVIKRGGMAVGALTIPKGDIVVCCGPASDLDPRSWHEPTQFKPSRFAGETESSPAGAEATHFNTTTVGHGSSDYVRMMAFGGGSHMCSGRRFGFLQVSTIWTILLRDFELEMTTPVPKPAYNDMVVGPDGPVMVKFKRKVPA
jgi:sterol 14alpha-demethylase